MGQAGCGGGRRITANGRGPASGPGTQYKKEGIPGAAQVSPLFVFLACQPDWANTVKLMCIGNAASQRQGPLLWQLPHALENPAIPVFNGGCFSLHSGFLPPGPKPKAHMFTAIYIYKKKHGLETPSRPRVCQKFSACAAKGLPRRIPSESCWAGRAGLPPPFSPRPR